MGRFGRMALKHDNIIYETSRQSRFNARYWMLGAGAPLGGTTQRDGMGREVPNRSLSEPRVLCGKRKQGGEVWSLPLRTVCSLPLLVGHTPFSRGLQLAANP